MDTVKIHIIIGSTRQNRFSEKPAHWLYEEAKKRSDLEVELVDLRDYPMPFYEDALPPKALKGVYSNEVVKKFAQKIAEADGYIIVTPEYNHGYPAVLKNAFDHVYFEWNRKAVGFVSYGSVMGARSVEQLREVSIEMKLAPIQPSINIPSNIYMAVAKPKEGETGNPFDSLKDHTDIFLDELIWWTKTLKAGRNE